MWWWAGTQFSSFGALGRRTRLGAFAAVSGGSTIRHRRERCVSGGIFNKQWLERRDQRGFDIQPVPAAPLRLCGGGTRPVREPPR